MRRVFLKTKENRSVDLVSDFTLLKALKSCLMVLVNVIQKLAVYSQSDLMDRENFSSSATSPSRFRETYIAPALATALRRASLVRDSGEIGGSGKRRSSVNASD